jgi:hypothetical protein
MESRERRTTGWRALPFSVDASDRVSKMCPIDRDIATPTIGCDAFGSSYATATLSPADATLTLAGFLPNTIGTGEWKVLPLSIEWAKKIPAPFSGSEKYAMCT